MAPKLFCTGVTGYIGGDFLYLVSKTYPEWEITCLVRNSDKGAKVASVYPKIKLVYGDLDSFDLIDEESSKCDIVYHFANCDHERSAKAIAQGLSKRQSDKPGYWIHTSGAMILATETFANKAYGEKLEKEFDDWDNISALLSHPDQAAHRNVDKIVLAAGSNHVKTAIVCPPTIYAEGRGPDNKRSVQVNEATRLFLETKQAFYVGKGQNIWHEVHVQDLSKLYLLLGEAAVNDGSPATWNDQGYYLAENGSFVWGELLSKDAEICFEKGLLPSKDVKSYTPEEVENLGAHMSAMIGTTSRGKSIRGKKLLGWKPNEKSLIDELPTIVESEARRLGLIKGHAAKVQE